MTAHDVTMFLRTLLSVLMLASAAPAVAQPAAECPTSECAPSIIRANRLHAQLWQEAAAIHQIKVSFVGALQRFVRAQAGIFGDEGDELRASLQAMREALSQWDAAIRTFDARASRDGRDAEVWVALATVWLDRHRIDATLRALNAAEQIDDNRADLYALRALAYGASDRTEEAVGALRRAVRLDARDPTLSYVLARRLTQLGRADEASQTRRALQRSLAEPRRASFARVDLLSQTGTAPIFPQARYAAGFAALDAGDYDRALATFADAVQRDPLVLGAPETRAAVARAADALRKGQVESVLRDLQDIAVTHSEPEIHRLLGLAFSIDQQSGNSIEHLRMAIRLAPDDERARVLLSDVLVSDGRLAEAERELTLASDAGIRSGQIAYRLAQLYQRQSLLPRAAEAFTNSERFAPIAGRDAFYQSWGSLLVNQADFGGAIAAYRKRIDVNANSAEAHRQLGEIYFLQGHDEEALTEFLVATWLDPKDARAHAASGQVYARLSKSSDAIAALQRALALDGSLREARYALGTALIRSGKTEDGRRELELFARQQADAEAAGQREFQLDALRRHATKAALAGNHDQAIALLQQAVALDAGPRSLRDLGVALMRAQRFGEAIDPLLRAQQVEEAAEGYVYLVEAYAADGHLEAAERQRTSYREFVVRERARRIRALEGR